MDDQHGRTPGDAPRVFAGLPLDRPRIMGIVNVTPDSFSDGGRLTSTDAARDHALRLEDEGADILDIGGESTRPGAEPVSVDEELSRVIPVIEALAEKTTARLSIDTRNARVMGEAVAAGAHIVNDVSALTHDPLGLAMAAEMGVPVFLMHAQGDPQTMQENPRYDDVVTDIRDWLSGRIAACIDAGIAREQIAIDPGIGFGKTIEHNLVLLKHVDAFTCLGAPILVGASRKGFIGRLSGVDTAADRIAGSLAAALAAVAGGADFIRVHDVEETRQALSVWTAIDTIDLWRDA
ncbi:MAG: dihydropteroate synthase [Pseudomonadota bacterium]